MLASIDKALNAFSFLHTFSLMLLIKFYVILASHSSKFLCQHNHYMYTCCTANQWKAFYPLNLDLILIWTFSILMYFPCQVFLANLGDRKNAFTMHLAVEYRCFVKCSFVVREFDML